MFCQIGYLKKKILKELNESDSSDIGGEDSCDEEYRPPGEREVASNSDKKEPDSEEVVGAVEDRFSDLNPPRIRYFFIRRSRPGSRL